MGENKTDSNWGIFKGIYIYITTVKFASEYDLWVLHACMQIRYSPANFPFHLATTWNMHVIEYITNSADAIYMSAWKLNFAWFYNIILQYLLYTSIHLKVLKFFLHYFLCRILYIWDIDKIYIHKIYIRYIYIRYICKICI